VNQLHTDSFVFTFPKMNDLFLFVNMEVVRMHIKMLNDNVNVIVVSLSHLCQENSLLPMFPLVS
jgi:hypothetical protein